MIKTEYKKCDIHYSEHTDIWICDNLNLEAKTLSALKIKMSKFLSNEFKGKKIKVFVYTWSSGWAIKTVTSITDEGSIWVKDSDGMRSKISPDKVYFDSEKNRNHVKRINELKQELENFKENNQENIKAEKEKMDLFSLGRRN